jgi:ketosteroid isomerase-like protein
MRRLELDLIRNEIEEAEQREAEAMLHADVANLDVLWDDQLLAYSTANLYARKATLLGLLKKGGLRLQSHSRKTLEVTVKGQTAIAIGNERSELIADSSGTLMICSYLNVWIKRDDRWKLLARHVGQIARVRSGVDANG